MYVGRLIAMTAFIVLSGCQAARDAANERAALVCLSAGIGETSPQRDECMRTVGAVALRDERRARFRDATEGLDLIARGLQSRRTE
jgi:hypothetical protein